MIGRSNRIRTLGILLLLAAARAEAQDPALRTQAVTRAYQVTALLEQSLADSETAPPPQLLANARAIALIPVVAEESQLKHGSGLLVHRTEDGSWGSPIFVELEGLARTDASAVLLIFRSGEGVGDLVDGTLRLDENSDIAAGPLGPSAQGFDAAIYGYARSQDNWAGMALDAVSLRIAVRENEQLFGPGFDARGRLLSTDEIPAELVPFVNALAAGEAASS